MTGSSRREFLRIAAAASLGYLSENSQFAIQPPVASARTELPQPAKEMAVA
jgi:hypothetical protein